MNNGIAEKARLLRQIKCRKLQCHVVDMLLLFRKLAQGDKIGRVVDLDRCEDQLGRLIDQVKAGATQICIHTSSDNGKRIGNISGIDPSEGCGMHVFRNSHDTFFLHFYKPDQSYPEGIPVAKITNIVIVTIKGE